MLLIFRCSQGCSRIDPVTSSATQMRISRVIKIGAFTPLAAARFVMDWGRPVSALIFDLSVPSREHDFAKSPTGR